MLSTAIREKIKSIIPEFLNNWNLIRSIITRAFNLTFYHAVKSKILFNSIFIRYYSKSFPDLAVIEIFVA